MKTAIEWLIDEHFGGIENCTPDFRMRIEQAKEIFKQQIIEAAKYGNSFEQGDLRCEVYYKETFKTDKG